MEDVIVLQSGLSCADNVKHISESMEFRLFQSIMQENLPLGRRSKIRHLKHEKFSLSVLQEYSLISLKLPAPVSM